MISGAKDERMTEWFLNWIRLVPNNMTNLFFLKIRFQKKSRICPILVSI